MTSPCPLHDRQSLGIRDLARKIGFRQADKLPICSCTVGDLRFKLAVLSNKYQRAEGTIRFLKHKFGVVGPVEDDLPEDAPEAPEVEELPKVEPPKPPRVKRPYSEPFPIISVNFDLPVPPPPKRPYVPVDPMAFVEARIRELTGEDSIRIEQDAPLAPSRWEGDPPDP